MIFQHFNYVHGCSDNCCVFRAEWISRLLIVMWLICRSLSCQKMRVTCMVHGYASLAPVHHLIKPFLLLRWRFAFRWAFRREPRRCQAKARWRHHSSERWEEEASHFRATRSGYCCWGWAVFPWGNGPPPNMTAWRAFRGSCWSTAAFVGAVSPLCFAFPFGMFELFGVAASDIVPCDNPSLINIQWPMPKPYGSTLQGVMDDFVWFRGDWTSCGGGRKGRKGDNAKL